MSVVSEIEVGTDSRHVFLSARDVMARYGWGKTKGYQNLKDRDLVPPPVMRHPDRWRLDQLLAWEDSRIARAHKVTTRSVEPGRGRDDDMNARLTSMLPQPKRHRSA